MSTPKVTPIQPEPQTASPSSKLPLSHHAVSCALAKADAALDLLIEWMRMICIDVVGEELEHAKVAYAKAVGDKTAVAP